VPLRKPSDFFNEKTPKSSLDVVKEQLDSAAPEKIEKISEVFDHFKTNFSHLQKLSDFTNSFGSFASSVEKVNALSEEVESLQGEIQEFIKREDLDDAMLAQMFFVEQTIEEIQNKIKSINEETLFEIQEQVVDITNKVNNFVDVESISFQKSIVESETRIDNRFLNHKQDIDSKVNDLEEKISDRFLSIVDTIEGINEENLERVKKDIIIVDKKVENILEKDLPKYKKFFADTELKTEARIAETETLVQEKLEEAKEKYESDIDLIREQLNDFINTEVPKFKNSLIEVRLHSEDEVNKISAGVNEKLVKAYEDIENLQKELKDKDKSVDSVLSEKIAEIKNFIDESRFEIESTSKTYENLYNDFKQREIYESRKLEEYSKSLGEFSTKLENLENTLTEDVCELQSNLDISTSTYYDVLKKEVGYFEENISNKIKDLEINFVRNEKHIENARQDLQDALVKLNVEEIEVKNKNLVEKINQLEKILEKFDEKKLLSEDASLTLAEPPNVKNKDPLTPLDQNYVTLKDLQDHYRLFINRVQQQLATIGGGGAGYVKDLSDVSFDESTGANKLLIYDGTNWVGIASTALSGGSSTLIGLTDVDSSNIGDGRFLRYDASSSKFTFAPVSATNLELIAGDIQSGILTTTSTSPATVMSISASTYRSVSYQVQITEGTNYNMTTINVIHDGTTTYMSEYGTINQPIGIATFSSDISGGSLRLIGHPAFASSTTFKVVFTAIEVWKHLNSFKKSGLINIKRVSIARIQKDFLNALIVRQGEKEQEVKTLSLNQLNEES